MAKGELQRMAEGGMDAQHAPRHTPQQGGAMIGEQGVASALPVIRWHGWRPTPFDMTSAEQGGQVFLVFDREGDLALLPTATITYVCYAPLGEDDRWDEHGIEPIHVAYSAAMARHAVGTAVRELEADGWRVVGRLQATFQGVDTEDDFWERLDCAGERGSGGVR